MRDGSVSLCKIVHSYYGLRVPFVPIVHIVSVSLPHLIIIVIELNIVPVNNSVPELFENVDNISIRLLVESSL